jgi:hypothetical protein
MVVEKLSESERELLFREYKPLKIDDEFRRQNSSFTVQGSIRMSSGRYLTDDELEAFYDKVFSKKLP